MAKATLAPLNLSAIPIGVAPFILSSTTLVVNLNADLLDGQHGAYYTDIPGRLGYTPVNKAGDTMLGALALPTSLRVYNVLGSAGQVTTLSFDVGNNGLGVRDAQLVATNNGANQITLEIKVANAAAPATAISIAPDLKSTFYGNVAVGDGTGARSLRANGANSGASNGSFLSADLAGGVTVAMGNYSAIFGGTYNPAPSIYSSQNNISLFLASATANVTFAASVSTFYHHIQIDNINELRFFNANYFMRANTGLEFHSPDLLRWIAVGSERMRLTETIFSGSVAINFSDAIRSTSDSNGVGYTGAGIEMYFNIASDDGFIISYDRTAALWKTLRLYGETIDFYAGGAIAGKVTTTGLEDNAGNVRDIPQNAQNSAYTFVIGDRGKHIFKNNTTAYTWTIPPNSSVAFPVGTAITVVNDAGTGNVTIARGSGVVLMNGATDANFTLNTNTARTLLKVGTDRWRVL